MHVERRPCGGTDTPEALGPRRDDFTPQLNYDKNLHAPIILVNAVAGPSGCPRSTA